MTYIIDTGVLVAFLLKRDEFHNWAEQELGKITQPILTCEAVVVETMHLLGRYSGAAQKSFREFLRQGVLQIPFRLTENVAEVLTLMDVYADMPMDFADACLVRMSELYDDSKILTLDSDFYAYRKHRTQQIGLISPREKLH